MNRPQQHGKEVPAGAGRGPRNGTEASKSNTRKPHGFERELRVEKERDQHRKETFERLMPSAYIDRKERELLDSEDKEKGKNLRSALL
jgi:hypothetical protein